MKTHPKLESIFAEAIDLADPAHRGDFLDRACDGNPGLRNRVDALLSANLRAAAFMSEPAGIVQLAEDEAISVGEQPGDCVDRYKLLQQIGEGGMGTVFMAEQQEPVHRKVALKIVKPGLDTKEVIARFESERQALALMHHDHIARVLDAGATNNGRPFFVMELVKGIPITDFCNEAKLSTRQRLELFLPVCAAIQHAHQKGIIHRDIKPRNVLVTLIDGQPVPKVIDFGIAKAIDHRLTDKTIFTRFGEFVGTPAYMSPEQATISGIDVDTRSDVYSLGALLYELLAGTPPFEIERLKTMTPEEMRRFIRESTPLQPSAAIGTAPGDKATTVAQSRSATPGELKSQLHGELDWIVMRTLEKDRSRRYEAAIALADDLRRYLQNEPVTARPPTRLYRCRKFVARHRAAVGMATCLALILIIATTLSSWLAMSALQSQRRADDEAASLGEVVQFIKGSVLAQANPHRELNRNVKLRTVLDRAAQQLNNRGIQRPDVEATIRTTIGESYRSLGEYQQALVHLARARHLRLSEHAETDAISLRATNNLVETLLLAGMYQDAKPLLDTTLRLAARHPNNRHELATAMKLEAWRLEALDEHDRAASVLEGLLRARADELGTEHPEYYKALANLAFVRHSQGRLDEALDLLHTAQDGTLRETERWDPIVIRITSELAALHIARGEMDIAEDIYASTLAHAERILGPNHPETLTVKHGVALAHFSQQRIAQAEAMLVEILANQRQRLGTEHPSTLATMRNLALVRQQQQRHGEAEALFSEELACRRQAFGPRHRSTLDALSALAFFYLNQSRFQVAAERYAELVEAYRHTGRGDADLVTALTLLGLCQHKSGNSDSARETLVDARAHCQLSPPNPWLYHVVESLLGEVYLGLELRDQAEDALLSGYRGLKEVEESVPSEWKPMSLRAAVRRLAQFYDSSESSELRARAGVYHDELAALIEAQPTRPNSLNLKGQTGIPEDGKSN